MDYKDYRDYWFRQFLWQQTMRSHGGCGAPLYALILIGIVFLLCGCKSGKLIERDTKDSIRIEYRERIVKVPDTVYVDLPAQKAERTTADSMSHLENDYALSDARINPDGTLFHSLEIKAQRIEVPFEREDVERETVRDERHSANETQTVTEYVEKELTWWQRTRIYGFYLLLTVLVINHRKAIFGLLKRVII